MTDLANKKVASTDKPCWQQTFIDTYTKVAFAKLYDRKTPLTAAELLNDRVVSFYDEQDINLIRVLTAS